MLLVAETQVTSYGLLTLAGAAAIGLGAYLLYGEPAPGEAPVEVSPSVLVVTVGAFLLAGLGLAYVAARTRSMRAAGRPARDAAPDRHPRRRGGAARPDRHRPAGRRDVDRPHARRAAPRRAARRVRLVAIDGLTAIVEPNEPDELTAALASAITQPDPSAAPAAADRP